MGRFQQTLARSCNEQQSEGLKELLHEFQGIFREPTSLPPQRRSDHHIPLKPQADSIPPIISGSRTNHQVVSSVRGAFSDRCKGGKGGLQVEPDYLCNPTPDFEPEAVLSRSGRKINNKAVTVWLIKWKGRPIEEASWEIAADLKIRFPDFNP